MADVAVKQEFENVVSRDGDGNIVIKVSSLPAGSHLILDGMSAAASVQFIEPAVEQDNGSDVINASVDSRAYNIGDVLPSGWVVGPVSPTTGKPISMEPETGALDGYQTWHTGEGHASELREQGHVNARQPDANELNAIYNDVVVAGRNDDAKLNTSGSGPYGKYWSSTPDPDDSDNARVQYLDGGFRLWHFKDNANARVHCVRDEPELSLA